MNEPELAIQLPLEMYLDEDSEPVAEITGPEFGEEYEKFAGTEEPLAKYVDSLRPNVKKLAITAEEEGFDGEDDVITTIETPSVPVYIPPTPQHVEKRFARVETDYELRKAAKKPDTLLNWVKAMVAKGHTVESLIEYAKKSDPVAARDIETVWVTRDEVVAVELE